MTRGQIGAAILIAVLVAVAAALLWMVPEESWRALMGRIEALGPWIGVVLIGMMVLHNVVPVPAELIAASAGAMLGVAQGVLVIWVGAMLGAALAFWVARRFGRPLLSHGRAAPMIARLDRMVSGGSWQGLLMVRLLPVVSFNLVNYAAGLAEVGWIRFLWTTAIGIVPVTAMSVAAGAGLQMVGGLPAVIGIAVALAIWIAVRRFQSRRLRG